MNKKKVDISYIKNNGIKNVKKKKEKKRKLNEKKK